VAEWQTQETQNLPSFWDVWVRVPPPVHFMIRALVLLASLASAQPRCPQGAQAALEAHPYRPIACPTSTDPALSTAAVKVALRPAAEPAEKTLERLLGKWEGWTTFGHERCETLLTVERRGKAFWGKVQTREHKTLRLWTLEGELVPKGPGAALTARLGNWPKLSTKASLRFGAGDAKDGGFEVLLSDKKGPSQRAWFKREGKKLLIRYRDLRRPGVESAPAELASTKRPSL
jgi:hypothetical protein